MTTTAENIEAVARELGLSMTAEFVPFSKSRNKGEKLPSLNWKVTLRKDGRPFLETDYMAGSGHCPSYQQGSSNAPRSLAVRAECETGFVHEINGMRPQATNKPVMPKFDDVLWSLASDAEAIDHAGFESWASNFGADPDSRAAERTYRACLEVGLKLRAALGDDGLKRLRAAAQDY